MKLQISITVVLPGPRVHVAFRPNNQLRAIYNGKERLDDKQRSGPTKLTASNGGVRIYASFLSNFGSRSATSGKPRGVFVRNVGRRPGRNYCDRPGLPCHPCNYQGPRSGPSTGADEEAFEASPQEALPDWPHHFRELKRLLGHTPSGRPYGKGVRFISKSDQEFRLIQQYLTQLEC
ncbi:jg1272 [Pararge aegeria aegeria]|uniref:Jg1272 protein n=1 Tax=Pararge aegeria aegeria TaxID=348720 RepID=A0A8S4R124_9NEOP|nr:jg1272 [Pararge aegeria aegeria]